MGLFRRESHETDATQAVVFEVWGRGWPNTEVVGESYHLREIKALLPRRPNADGEELMVPVTLVHNPDNPHDRNAVEVRAATGLLGHLSRDDAARYAPALDSFQANGMVAGTTARIWGGERERWDTNGTEFVASVSIDLPEPHLLAPANRPPSVPYHLLPHGGAIQVSGEEEYMPAITPHLNEHGECWAYATLHEFIEQGARTSKILAEVRIDGNPVGRLTPKMSGDILPAVAYLAERGYATSIRALVKGNRLKAEVVLHMLRAYELPADWLASIEDLNTSAATVASVSAETTAVANGTSDAGRDEESRVDAPPPAPPAGWYTDPSGVARLRYWDGTGWTHHTSA